ncbi:MAG: dihydroorotase [Candidatus Eiseniibacteriota bacterium]
MSARTPAGPSLLFVNAQLADPEAGTLAFEDLLVVEGRTVARGAGARTQASAARAETVDLAGAVLAPGFVDAHVHLREPGQEDKETIASGTAAAVAGGFTSVACMPNTSPPLDEPGRLYYVAEKARRAGRARVHPVAAITLGLAGERLADLAALVEAGAVAFSDDGRPVMHAGLMRHALEYARDLGVPLVTHAEDLLLRGEGVMNEGPTATRLGLPGIPAACEVIAVERDLELAALTGARLHVAHVSAEGSVEALRRAKVRGTRATGETAPHYFALTDEAVARGGGYDTNAKMNPPLRSEADRAAVLAGLADGTLDVIATDHAPHTPREKESDFAAAPFGVVGLETALAVALTQVVRPGRLSLVALLRRFTTAPRTLLGLPDPLAPGEEADLVAFDPETRWIVDRSAFRSKGRNTPFEGHELSGRVLGTWVGGRAVYAAEPAPAATGEVR